MKEKLISNYCTSRKRIDQVAKNLNLSFVGPRELILSKIQNRSYSEIKKAITNIN